MIGLARVLVFCVILLAASPVLGVVTLGAGGGTYSYCVVNGDDINVTAVGWTLNGVTIYGGKFDVDAAVTMNNCIGYDGANNVLDIANAITATVTNCCFGSAKVAAEAAGGTATDTSCLWSTNPLFSNVARNDFSLRPNSPCVGAGKDLGSGNDLGLSHRGGAKGTRQGRDWDIGAYIYSGSRWGNFWRTLTRPRRWIDGF